MAPDSTPSVLARVLASLPEADRQRRRASRRRQIQIAGAVCTGAAVLIACLDPESSNTAIRTLAWLYGADLAWKGLVSALLGGFMLVPAASACCILAVSLLLWHRLLRPVRRGL
jgi:hypothetical protein